jgi:hypothetical protein
MFKAILSTDTTRPDWIGGIQTQTPFMGMTRDFLRGLLYLGWVRVATQQRSRFRSHFQSGRMMTPMGMAEGPTWLQTGSVLTCRLLLPSGRLTDCQALAAFADEFGNQSASQLVDYFKALTPSQFPTELLPGVKGTSGDVRLNQNMSATGFAAQYQDEQPNTDQAHHFAAFLQVGFVYGSAAGDLLAHAWEIMEGTPFNTHDMNLGEMAASFGAALKSGLIQAGQLGDEIRKKLCQH